eukprot:6195341-Pleurochrysis_carterae.AAC.3
MAPATAAAAEAAGKLAPSCIPAETLPPFTTHPPASPDVCVAAGAANAPAAAPSVACTAFVPVSISALPIASVASATFATAGFSTDCAATASSWIRRASACSSCVHTLALGSNGGGGSGSGYSSASASAVRACPATAACSIASATLLLARGSRTGSSGKCPPIAAQQSASRPCTLHRSAFDFALRRVVTQSMSPAVHALRSGLLPSASHCSSGDLAFTSSATHAPCPAAAAQRRGVRHAESVVQSADSIRCECERDGESTDMSVWPSASSSTSDALAATAAAAAWMLCNNISSVSAWPLRAAAWSALPSFPGERAGCAPCRSSMRTHSLFPCFAAASNALASSTSHVSTRRAATSRVSQQRGSPALLRRTSALSPFWSLRSSGNEGTCSCVCLIRSPIVTTAPSSSAVLFALSASTWKAVWASALHALISASDRKSSPTASLDATAHASSRGVIPRTERSSRDAPRRRSSSMSSMRPDDAAACNAVRPASSAASIETFSRASQKSPRVPCSARCTSLRMRTSARCSTGTRTICGQAHICDSGGELENATTVCCKRWPATKSCAAHLVTDRTRRK